MLRSLYTMLDYHIAATDGELGRVQDFFSTMKAGSLTISWLTRRCCRKSMSF